MSARLVFSIRRMFWMVRSDCALSLGAPFKTMMETQIINYRFKCKPMQQKIDRIKLGFLGHRGSNFILNYKSVLKLKLLGSTLTMYTRLNLIGYHSLIQN